MTNLDVMALIFFVLSTMGLVWSIMDDPHKRRKRNAKHGKSRFGS